MTRSNSLKSSQNREIRGLSRANLEVVVSKKRETFILTALAVTLAAGILTAQPLPVRLYGGNQDDQAHALVEGISTGFCIGGWTRSLGNGSSDAYVVKTDVNGTPQWAVASFGEDDEEIRSMVKTHDNCYVVTGWTESCSTGITNKDVFIAKLDSTGFQLWGYVYGGVQDDEAFSVDMTPDRGFVMTGRTMSFGPLPRPNIFVMKTDSAGMLQWMRTYWMFPNHARDEGRSIAVCPDSGYVVVGRANIFSQVLFDPYILKLDRFGNPTWVYVSNGRLGNDEAYSVTVDPYGYIHAAGLTRSYGSNPGNTDDIFVTQLKLSGQLTWSRTYGWAGGDEQVLDDRSLTVAGAGVALCGPTTSKGPGAPNPNFLIQRLNFAGMPMWVRTHPSPYHPGLQTDIPLPMIRMSNGGFACAGWTDSYSKPSLGGDNFHLATVDQNGDRPVCVEPWEIVVESMPWIEWGIEDSFSRVEHALFPMDFAEVLFDSVCYDSHPQGVRDDGRSALGRSQTIELRAATGAVRLNLARSVHVVVEAYSADGRRLAVLASGRMTAGVHRFSFPAGIPAGPCLVRAIAGKETAILKVVRYSSC